MPLIPVTLQNDLYDIYDKENRQPTEAANLYSSAIISLWESAITPGVGTVSAKHVKPIIQAACIDAWSVNTSTSLPAAQKIANALNTALASTIPSGGLFGTGVIIPLGVAALIAELIDVYGSLTDNPQQAAQKEANAIVTFTKNTLCLGTGSEPIPIPKIGPLT